MHLRNRISPRFACKYTQLFLIKREKRQQFSKYEQKATKSYTKLVGGRNAYAHADTFRIDVVDGM